MKTKAIQFTAYGNAALVQISSEPFTSFPFKPAGPAIKDGGLIISEVTASGSVGRLTAFNKTSDYLLLTDADVLAGAKQNRVVNRSVLLAPMGKTVIEVSCVERLRWDYSSPSFTSPGSLADPGLRSSKAETFSSKKDVSGFMRENTQSKVWDHVSNSLAFESCNSITENYSDLQKHRLLKFEKAFPKCQPGKGCNGLVVLLDGKVISADLFGNEEAFVHYFPMLRDAAFTLARTDSKEKQVDIHEAYYKALEALDEFEAAERKAEESYPGAGSLSMAETDRLVGFELLHNGELIHDALFARRS